MTHPTHAAVRPALVVLGLVVGLAGCSGSSGGSSEAAASTSPAPAAASSSASTSSPAPVAGQECGSAQAEVQAGVGVSGYVTGVEIVGQCTTAQVSTSLGTTTDDVDAAVGICRIAAVQAYSHGVSTVNIAASDGKGLAIGINGGECIAVPAG